MIGKKIKELRTERGLSQIELAKAISYSQTAISTWELMLKEPTGEAIIVLAKFFGVSADYLLGLEEYDYSCPVAPTITSQETEIIAKLRSLPPEALAAVNGYLDGLQARLTPVNRKQKYSSD